MSKSIVATGSITDVAPGGDTALALLDAKIALLCDRSASMYEHAYGGKARYELEDEIVAKLQAQYPGQVALIAFGDIALLLPDGVLPEPMGNTDMVAALDLAQPLADAGIRCVLITDGEPSDPEAVVIARARRFRGKLDTVYVGPEYSPGADFLQRLAAAVGGTHAVGDLAHGPELLEQHLTQLLLSAGGA